MARAPAFKQEPPCSNVGSSWPLLLLVALAVALGYGGIVTNGFYDIDDPSLLDMVSRGLRLTPHFRPLYRAWNTLLFAGFGVAAGPYYVVGMAVHAANAFMCALLVRRLTASAPAAIVAGLVFALFYSVHQVVMWIPANCGLLSVGFALLAALAWHAHVSTAARGAHVLALLASAGALASKEEGVVVGPLLLGVDGCVNGLRAFHPRALLTRYAAFVVLAIVYVAVAFRPDLWQSRPDVNQYAFGPELVPELLGNFALLFAIGQHHPAETSAVAITAGVALTLAIGFAAFRLRDRGHIVWAGLIVALFGLLPALPGPFAVAGTRYAYPASIGVALCVAGLFDAVWKWAAQRPVLRAAAALVLMLWLGAQVFAIHSVESWRYERGCAHLRNLVESTRSVLIALRADSSSGPTVAVLAPEIWNVSDYRAVVRVFAGELATPTSVEWFASSAESRALVAPGARLDPASVPVFTSFDEGHVQRLDARGADAFLSRLAESPRVYAGKSSGRVPVIWLDLVMPRIGG